jgi:hypothetical protein
MYLGVCVRMYVSKYPWSCGTENFLSMIHRLNFDTHTILVTDYFWITFLDHFGLLLWITCWITLDLDHFWVTSESLLDHFGSLWNIFSLLCFAPLAPSLACIPLITRILELWRCFPCSFLLDTSYPPPSTTSSLPLSCCFI